MAIRHLLTLARRSRRPFESLRPLSTAATAAAASVTDAAAAASVTDAAAAAAATATAEDFIFISEVVVEEKMIGQGSYMAPEVVVVGKQFTAPHPVDLIIVRKMMTISEGNFGVTDANGNIMFKVEGKFLLSLGARRILLDANGNPIVSLEKKIMSLHSRWKVYRGDSTESRDLLFTVKKSSLFQFKTELDVFLASNTSKDDRDFKIEGSWFEKSCTIYLGKSSNVIAQMHRKHSFSSIVLGKDELAVTVYPHVDYAFIVALIVILEEINEEGKNNGGGAS